ncbi:hypothetical protein SAMN05421767_10412 [Granulicatella balaenopterae]|uniref:AAA-like domain-containing protein n=1 Tax=Granulicatella balaenopterae TaxID=137733 RepID=A0A1H9I063_9LACT|nr:hypothetical protein [Granulicatella balaenopterae]SEQ67943.1 hypothetical protein SAMN05421767_10412 [Granulicatella balaenopterae]
MEFNVTKRKKELIKKKIIVDDRTMSKQEKKKKEKEEKQAMKLAKKSSEVVPVSGITSFGNDKFIRLKNGFAEVFQIGGYNLQGMDPSEIRSIIYEYEALAVMYVLPYKIITMNIPVDTTKQQQYYREQLENTDDLIKKGTLNVSLAEMEVFNEETHNKEFFVMIYGQTIEELRENCNDFLTYCGRLNIYKIPMKKKRILLFRMSNPLSPVLLLNDKENSKVELTDEQYDFDFYCDVQPIGGITFKDTYVQTGEGYSTSLYVYKLPSEPDGLWMNEITNIPDTIVTEDIVNRDTDDVLKQLSKAMREQYSRFLEEKDAYDQEIAAEEYSELKELGKAIRKSQEGIKYFTVRIYLYAQTKEELDKKVLETKKILSRNQFGATNLLMEQKEEWQSMFLSAKAQELLPNKRVGRDVPTANIGYTFPANHVFLHDDRGKFLGYSFTGGHIIFDGFEIDTEHRKHYNMIILGDMGSGKSTLLKKLFVDWHSKGTLIRGFDYSGEFTALINRLGGSIIALDGSAGRVNIFEIFPSLVNEDGTFNERANYTQHTSKLATWYSILKPEAPTEEIDVFELLISKLYETFGFDLESPDEKFLGLEPYEYPILSDLIDVIETELMNEQTIFKKDLYSKIHITLTKLKQNFGVLFDGHTTIPKLQSEQIVYFNAVGLVGYQDNIRNAQIFNAQSLCWSDMVIHGKEQARLYDEGKITFANVKRAMLVIDECHNQINHQNLRQVTAVNKMQREGRKIFCGVALSTQAVNSLAPENMTDMSAEALKEIYNFSQYRFFFNLPVSSISRLKTLSHHTISDGQINRIGNYRVGYCLLNMNGGQNYEFNVHVTPEELDIFKGGGRRFERE